MGANMSAKHASLYEAFYSKPFYLPSKYSFASTQRTEGIEWMDPVEKSMESEAEAAMHKKLAHSKQNEMLGSETRWGLSQWTI